MIFVIFIIGFAAVFCLCIFIYAVDTADKNRPCPGDYKTIQWDQEEWERWQAKRREEGGYRLPPAHAEYHRWEKVAEQALKEDGIVLTIPLDRDAAPNFKEKHEGLKKLVYG